MYPFLRLGWNLRAGLKDTPLGLTDTHLSRHRVMPWDLDMFGELNNGLTLTVYDLGRFGLAARGGLIKVLRDKRWGLTMAGASIRYRRRLTLLERIEMKSRVTCWDDRFIYLEQAMFKANGDCASHILYRSAVVEKGRVVPPDQVLAAMGQEATSPTPPNWIAAWIKAEALRPWPPMSEAA
ncbi:MAG: acyl-CoA thioesterase [Pseudomonadota bacterium]